MKIQIKIALLALLFVGSAHAQDLVINDDCTVALNSNEAVVFQSDGDIVVTTSEPIPTNCVEGVVGGGGAVALASTKASVETDESFNLTYAVPEGTYTCTLRRGSTTIRTNSQISRPTGSVNNQTITADATYTMSCSRNANQGVETASATALVDFTGTIVNPPPDGTNCAQLPNGTRQNSMNIERNNNINTVISTWDQMFGAFPMSETFQSSAYRASVERGKYVSLPFTVPSNAANDATITLTWEDSTGGSTSTIVSVSTCIGGVLASQALPQSGLGFCHVVGRSSGGSLRIGVDSNLANCQVEKGQSYYLNIMDYSETTNSTTCDNATCTWLVQGVARSPVQDN